MKTTTLIILCFVSLFSFAQPVKQKLTLECSPLMVKTDNGLFFTFDGRIHYQFNKRFSLSAHHNQCVKGFFTGWAYDLNPDPFKKSSFSELVSGITLFHTKKPLTDINEKTPTLNQQLVLDVGINYYRFATLQADYYSYDMDSMGNYKVINSINRLSASLGISHIIRRLNTKDPENIVVKRQHLLSAGFYIGLNYDLQGFVMIPGENPSTRPPKNYNFQVGGFYGRYNFRQRLTKHLFIGADLSFTRMPYVKYKANKSLYVPRGGERELPFQSYAGITIGCTL